MPIKSIFILKRTIRNLLLNKRRPKDVIFRSFTSRLRYIQYSSSVNLVSDIDNIKVKPAYYYSSVKLTPHVSSEDTYYRSVYKKIGLQPSYEVNPLVKFADYSSASTVVGQVQTSLTTTTQSSIQLSPSYSVIENVVFTSMNSEVSISPYIENAIGLFTYNSISLSPDYNVTII